MTETSNLWRVYEVSGQKEGKILLNTLWNDVLILVELTGRGFLRPPFDQYTLKIDPQDGHNLEVFQEDFISSTKLLKLTRTPAPEEKNMPTPTPNNITDEDLAKTLREFNDYHFPNRTDHAHSARERLRVLLNSQYGKTTLPPPAKERPANSAPNEITDKEIAKALRDYRDYHIIPKNPKLFEHVLDFMVGRKRLPTKKTSVPPVKRWFDLLFQKTLLLQDHERLSDDLLRHLFVSTIQHLQLGYSLISERRTRTRQPANNDDDAFFTALGRFNERHSKEAGEIPHPIDHTKEPISTKNPSSESTSSPAPTPAPKLWWQDEKRFEIFASLAKQVICAAYDRALHQARWRNRTQSPLARYLQNAIRLGKMNGHPKFNNPPKWDTLPNAAEIFARSLQLALRSPASYLHTAMANNLSHLLADLEKKLGLYPGFRVSVLKETVDAPKTAP